MKRVLMTLGIILSAHLISHAQGYEFYEPLSQFTADKSALDRKYSLSETNEYYDRIRQLYNDWQDVLENIDYEALSRDGKVDYILFRNYLQRSLHFHDLSEKELNKVKFVTDQCNDLYQFIRERRRGKNVDGAAKAAIFHDAAGYFKKANESLSNVEPFESWIQAERAAAVVKDLRDNLTEAFRFYYGYHPEFTWWTEKPYDRLIREMTAYEDNLKQHYSDLVLRDDGSGIIGRPEGREALIKLLQFEFIPYSPEELVEIGWQQFEWCREEMIKNSRQMGFGDDWRSALEYVKDQYVPAGEQPAVITKLANEAIDFIEGNDLLTVPELAKEVWRMRMMSPARQLVNPFFTGGETISISYPTNTMEHDAKMMSLRGNNPHFCMATVHHELIAGHHLQGFFNQRYKPYRRPFRTSFWGEGWALHWEFLLYEKGLPQTPEDRMGFLFWRKHRAARIIFSLSFHLEKMTPQECIEFLVNEVGHEPANAEAEIRRSFMSAPPLYQLAYMIGGLQFKAMKEELVDTGIMSYKEFHDSILRQNSIPVEVLREILKDEDLPIDFETRWRFMD